MSEILNALKKQVGKMITMQTVLGTVKSVDETKLTCVVSPLSEDADFPEVRLKASIDDVVEGVYAIPVVGSVVGVSMFNNDDSYTYISIYSAIEKYIICCLNGAKIEFNNDGKIIMNDGANEGLVKVIELVEKLNSIENLVNDLVEKFNQHIHSNGGGPTGTPQDATQTPIVISDSLTPTVKSDIENENVKH